jgi:hypothetical protein
MMRRLLPLSLICTLLMTGVARSTTVIPPTFESMVAGANTIFVGEVMHVRSAWAATRQGRAFGATTQLDFMGGEIGGVRMEVVGMPVFHEGQRGVLFVSGERAVSPLVGFWHGRLRIERDVNGVDRVRTHDGRSLGHPSEIGPQRPSYMLSITPMRLADLENAVRSRVLAGRAR